jgi:hypothetical protein
MKASIPMKFSTVAILCTAAVFAVLLRFVPVPLQNFSAMGALAVLCGVTSRQSRLALFVPFAARLVSDVLLQIQTGYGFYSTMGFDYAAYGLIFLAARRLQPRGLMQGVGTGLLAAAIFFLVSNFGVWCLPFNGQYLYPQTLAGLQQCLTLALPFARGTLVSDVLLTPLFLAAAAALQTALVREAAAFNTTTK